MIVVYEKLFIRLSNRGSQRREIVSPRAEGHWPGVIRYLWSHRGERNRWVRVAPSFRQFAEMLEL